MIKVGLLGSSGRMGKQVSTLLVQEEFSKRLRLIAEASQGSPLEPLLDADVVIDFSLPEAMTALTSRANQKSTPPLPAFVIGSTGWTDEQKKELRSLARKTPVLVSSNFSIGIHALLQIMRYAAPRLANFGYSATIVETHHKHKKDAPSGTAIALQNAINPDHPSGIQTHSIRAGEIIGDHEVTFYGSADHLTVGHFAQDRSVFARGAIHVAEWLVSRKANYRPDQPILTMDDFFKERFQ